MKPVGWTGRGWLTRETVLLFGIALGVRFVMWVAQGTFGVQGVPGLPMSAWGDFHTTYASWLGLMQQGLVPYRDFGFQGYTYKYTPLFIYILYPFFAAGGAAGAAIPIVVSDAATAVLVCLIVKKFAANRIAFAAGLAYAVSPFVLYYEDYLWLSSQPMTLFLLLAIYFLKENRPVLSIFTLGVAVMIKQQALFILPVYLVLYAKDFRGSLLKGTGLFVAVLVGVSLPFLAIAPKDYIYAVDYFPISIGTPEPGQAIASAIINAAVAIPNTVRGCGITTLPGLYTGSVCGSIVNTQEFASWLLMGQVNQIAFFLSPLLLVLFAAAAISIRKAPNFSQIACTYSYLGALLLFAAFVEPYVGYYFVPVYALILASVTDLRTLAVGGGATILSAMMPEGPFQIVLPLVGLLLITVSEDKLIARGKTAPSFKS